VVVVGVGETRDMGGTEIFTIVTTVTNLIGKWSTQKDFGIAFTAKIVYLRDMQSLGAMKKKSLWQYVKVS